MPNVPDIELRTGSVHEVMGRIPPWTIRYGISVIFGLILLLLILAWLIRYPDVIAAKGILTSLDPPRDVVARSDGRLVVLKAADGTTVDKNAPLAVIESSADPLAMDTLRSLLPVLEAVIDSGVPPHISDLNIGEGRTALADLRTTMAELQVWRTETYRTERNAGLRTKVSLFQKMIRASEDQLAWAARKQENYLSEAKIDTALAGKGVMATSEFRTKQNAFMDQQMNYAGLQRALQQNRISLLELEAQLNDLLHADDAKQRDLEERYRAKLDALRSFLSTWQLAHTLNAPVSGQVHYPGRLTLNQPVKTGDVLFHVAPTSESYIVEATVLGDGAGKVKVGQQAYVRLDAFPSDEYGQLIGTIESVASMANAEGYRVVIDLPHGLTTSFHRVLPFRPEMKGRVQVVARERSLLGRVFDRLRGMADR
jgi:HlyD family secretion protein